MLHDAREYQSLYKDMIDQLYPLMTHAKRAKEGAVGQMDLEKKVKAFNEIASQYKEAKFNYDEKSMEVLSIRQHLDNKQMFIDSYFRPSAGSFNFNNLVVCDARTTLADTVLSGARYAEKDGEEGDV